MKKPKKEKYYPLTLSPRTLKLIEEAFGDKKCHKCGEKAERIQNEEFLCHACARATCEGGESQKTG